MLSLLLALGIAAAPAGGDEGEGWAYRMANELMSPYCPGRTLAECPSGQAETLRVWLIVQEASGRSRAEVQEELVERWHAMSDLFVHTVRSDAVQSPVLRALATGVPALVSTGAGASEVVREGVNGHVVDPTDAEGIAERIMRGEANGIGVTIFEISNTRGLGIGTRISTQTVICFDTPQLALPWFFLRQSALLRQLPPPPGLHDIDLSESPRLAGMHAVCCEEDSSTLAFSAASFRRCRARASLRRSMPCSFLNSSAR